MLAVDEPPAMQHRLLHGRHKEPTVGADGHTEMRALPIQDFRLSLGIGKPE